jgi:cell division protein FtsI (penicillin-binding protein 3)
LVRRLENWSAISIGAVSMGQEVGTTPLQLVTAFSAIANGGLLNKPGVVREIRRGGQGVPARQGGPAAADAPRRVIRPETAATLRRMLEGVILEGTGKLARLEGYTAAGKTGTAQKIDPATGRYSLRDYIASFIGFAPVNSPAISVLVALDSPLGGHHGGDVAAPAFREVTQQTLAYLRVPPDLPVGSPAEQASLRAGGASPQEDLSDFNPGQLLDPDSQRIDLPVPATPSVRDAPSRPANAPTPHAGASRAGLSGLAGGSAPQRSPGGSAAAPEAQVRDPATETTVVLDEATGVPVPDFSGKPVRTVIEQCVRLGLSPVPVGAGIAVDQAPAAGTRVRAGSRIVVRFAASARLRAISQQEN